MNQAPGSSAAGAPLRVLAWVATLLSVAWLSDAAAQRTGEFVAPNPWVVLNGTLPQLPAIDATSPCFPIEVAKRTPALQEAKRGQLSEALEELEQRIAKGEADTWAQFVRWVLIARTTRDPADRRAALDALVTLARDFPSGRTQQCFQLEAARLELLRQNYPEAAAWARRAESATPETGRDAAIAEEASFLRAEALYLSGRRPQAGELYAPLEQSARRALADAARLRGADLAAAAGRPEAALPRYQELMPRASSFGADGGAWAAHVGEAAFQAAEYAAALAWFRRSAEQSESARQRALAEIRVADSAGILGKLPESRALLDDIAEFAPDPEVRDLANIRLAVPPVGSRAPGEESERLRQAAASPNPRVSQYARAELGRGHLEAEDASAALDVFTRLAFEKPDRRLAPWLLVHLGDAIERVAAGAVSERGCRELIQVIGWRRDFLLRASERAQPFLALGACYEEAGLPRQAIHLYRSLVQRFGVRVAKDVSLPLARAALGAGELGVAKAAAEARAEAGAGPAWARLLAQIYVAEGREREALETLRGLLEAGGERGPVHAQATWLLAVLGFRVGDLEGVRPVLGAADPVLGPELGLTPNQRGDVYWVRAEARRNAGLLAAAARDYQSAVGLLEPGTRRAAAAYWLGVLAEDPERERHHYGVGKDTGGGGLWAILAGEELALSRLRERYGRPEALRQ